MNKKYLIDLMNSLDFLIADIDYINGCEMVAKKCQDGRLIWWSAEKEGSGFQRLFKNAIKQACENDVYEFPKCDQCENKENLIYGTNPFNPSLNILLCEKCRNIPFSKFNNNSNM